MPRNNHLTTSLRVGAFLAFREIKRANIWTTGLIAFVMTLTFLNLVVVSGILVGLIQGSEEAYKRHYTGDLIISTYPNTKDYIEHSQDIITTIKALPSFASLSARYLTSGTVTTNYRDTLLEGETYDATGASIAGIDPETENEFSDLSKLLVEGQYLEPNDTEGMLIGANLLFRFTPIEAPGFTPLRELAVGDRVQITVGEKKKEVVVRGIIKGKVDQTDSRVFMIDSEVRKLAGRTDLNVGEISVRLTDPELASVAKEQLLQSGVGEYARVQTALDAQPKFLTDIKVTFALLGNAIGSIGLAVASITIFIVVFVNAITRRRYIGIMKGIGVSPTAIIISYVIQSLFYAFLGVGVGFLIVFLFLKPFFIEHPLNFPFSDGILVATVSGTLLRAMVLFIATIIAGYIPAKLIIRQNTLSAILGR